MDRKVFSYESCLILDPITRYRDIRTTRPQARLKSIIYLDTLTRNTGAGSDVLQTGTGARAGRSILHDATPTRRMGERAM
jgi:hypothetical protein